MKNIKKHDVNETWINMLLGVLAIVALKSIFENDNSKIISKEGKKILSDEDRMQDINKKIEKSESSNSHAEILI